MPYIGRAATNAGSVNYLDDISSGFDGSDTTFTCAISGTTITPGQENVYLYLDGVFQHPTDAYSISGSTITFTEAPASGVAFTGYVAGEGAYLDDGTVSTAKLDDDAVTASKLDDDGTGFQVGDLGVGGSLTSGDKLTVTGRLRASGGIIGDLTGDVTGNVTGNTSGTAATVTGAAQSAITSLGTLTTLTVDDITLNDSTISDAADLTFDIGGDIILDADGEHIWLKDGGTTIGNIDFGSSNITIRNSVSNADLIFRGNDGGTEVEAMRINYSGNNVGIGTSSIGAKLHIADNRSTAYSSTGEPAETIIAHNKNGTDDTGVNNYASLSFQVADGATSQGFLNYIRTGNNTGELTFSQRTGSSSYAEHMKIENNGNATFAGELRVNGGQASIYGAEGGNAILELNSDEADDNADRWQMYVFNTNNYLKWRHYSTGSWVDRLWLSSATDNWAMNLTGNSPYGMQITTTSDGSSSHDAFAIKRASNTKVFEIFNDGTTKIYGNIIPQTNNAYDLGSSSLGWRNIYTNDLNLSNMDSNGNDVDGTKGSWTIQEGEDDLFLINRTNGKKYKFKLEMV